MIQDDMAKLMQRVFDNEIMALREAGQKEYAHNKSNAFANFERAASDLGLDRKMILWIFAMKHRDGIAAFLKGHRSQREDVRGRINDLIVYLFLLRGMIDEETSFSPPPEVSSAPSKLDQNVPAPSSISEPSPSDRTSLSP